MRRPAVFFAGAFGIGIISSFMTDIDPVIWMLSLTALSAYVIYIYLNYGCGFRFKIITFLCIFSLGGVWFAAAEMNIDPLTEKTGEFVNVTGTVTEAEVEDDSCNLVIKTNTGKTIVKYYEDGGTAGQYTGKIIHVYGSVELPQERRNPRCFDYRLYLRSCDIQTVIRAERIEISENKGVPYLRLTAAVKDSFRQRIAQYMDENKQGLLMAIMFGDKTMLNEEVYSEFQRTGTAHVLAVSGLHTGIIYAFFVFLWRGKKGAVFYIVSFVLLFLYMSLADFSPSVVRAASMILLHSMAGLLRCRYDLLTAASMTFSAMLFKNPYQIFNTGFQLSFLAVVSLAVIIPFVQRFYQGVFLSAAAIQAGMIPYTAYVFNYISAGAVLANIPVIFIAGIILPVGLCSILTLAIPGDVFAFLVTVIDVCCDVLVWINGLFYASGKTSFDVISPPLWVLVLYYGIFFFFVSETGQLQVLRRKRKSIAAVILIICMAAFMSIHLTGNQFLKAGIVFVDVGQGDCIHIRTDSGKNYLIDGGGSADYDTGMKVLKPYLLKNGVSQVDAAFVTHLHEDHYGGIRSLAADGMIDKVAVYEANSQLPGKLEEEINADVMYIHKGYRISLDEDVFIDVLSPAAGTEEEYKKMIQNEEDENKISLIMKVNYKGVTVLVTGDIDEEGERDLVEQCGESLACDIMKVPHHGSKYSSSELFLDTAAPDLAVFQVGRNNYGHPSDEAAARYIERECDIVRNDKDGAIGICIRDNNVMEVIKMIH